MKWNEEAKMTPPEDKPMPQSVDSDDDKMQILTRYEVYKYLNGVDDLREKPLEKMWHRILRKVKNMFY